MTDHHTRPAPADRRERAARLLDIRRIIGGLFIVYGVILAITGLLDGQPELAKAEGIRINLWTGLAMLAFGALLTLWAHFHPTEPPADPHDDDHP